MPASSMARAESSISSSGSMVSCITPTRNGTLIGRPRSSSRLDLALERAEHLLDLLVDDRLQHALAHRADGAGDADVGLPGHRRVLALAAQGERGLHVHERADALALGAHRRVLERALVEILERDRHLEAAEAERD